MAWGRTLSKILFSLCNPRALLSLNVYDLYIVYIKYDFLCSSKIENIFG